MHLSAGLLNLESYIYANLCKCAMPKPVFYFPADFFPLLCAALMAMTQSQSYHQCGNKGKKMRQTKPCMPPVCLLWPSLVTQPNPQPHTQKKKMSQSIKSVLLEASLQQTSSSKQPACLSIHHLCSPDSNFNCSIGIIDYNP